MSDASPQYQPLPWSQVVGGIVGSHTHDCAEHHNNFDGTPLVHNGYDASVLKERANRLRNASINNPTTAQRFLQYEIVTDFLLADFENSTFEQIQSTLEHWSELLDRYFFGGYLTQGPEKLITLCLYSITYKLLYGFTSNSIGSPARRIVIVLRDQFTGIRYSKATLIDTLLQQMVHAFVNIFYNYCPLKENSTQEVFRNGGRGDLFENIFHNASNVVATWHPEFSYFDHYPKPVLQEPAAPRREREAGYISILDETASPYYPPMGILNRLRSQWYGRTPGVLNPVFRRAVLPLQHSNIQLYIFSQLPFLLTILKIILVLNVIIICHILLLLWWCEWLEWFFALVYYGYVITNSEKFIARLWFRITSQFLVWLVTNIWWFTIRDVESVQANSRTKSFPR